MSYTKQNWQTGDNITASKLNHMEDGIESAGQSSGGGFVVNITWNEGVGTFDKTAREIATAMIAGEPISFVSIEGDVHGAEVNGYLFNGAVWADSGANEGSTFYLYYVDSGAMAADIFFSATMDEYPHTGSQE